ncbi:MAG: hypothetical protein ACD_8C00038G0001 [uncultured bacterium]|nr:MAG: hypothetical protein ACD_8C00038G0001 [uncultured bacterium]
MSKNRIIPQMFDVRPVDEAGDLDWKKIQAVEVATKCVGDDPLNDGHIFNLKKEEQRNFLQQEKKRLEQKQKEITEKIKKLQKEKDAELILQKKQAILKKQELVQSEVLVRKENLKKISQQNRIKKDEYEKAVMLEREKRDQELARWLEKEREEDLKAQKLRDLVVEDKIKKEKDSELIFQREQERLRRQEAVQLEAQSRKEELEKIKEYNRKKAEEYEKEIMLEREKRDQELAIWLEKEREDDLKAQKLKEASIKARKKKNKQNWVKGSFFSFENFPIRFETARPLLAFAVVAVLVFAGVGSVAYVNKGLGLEGRVLGSSTDGLENLNLALADIKNQNFESSSVQFEKALANFSDGSEQLESMGGILLDATRFVPFATKVSSGKNAVDAGKHFSAVGKYLNEVAKASIKLKNPIDQNQKSEISLLDFFAVAQENIGKAKKELDLAQENIDKIAIDDLPEDKQDKFLLIKQNLPDLRFALDTFLSNSHIFADLLGANGPRKYLFLFQNNTEMRATGGFIGSYGLLDISNGHVKKFFIDGIFNPDGQLRDRIVPPAPIQKISTNWSMHDSNWFADFPVSAKKAISFYEKTGGPTADGVITLTPTVMQKLLEITGPIEMPEYDVTLDSENFIELTQYKVEVDYDKEENKPKKILSDLAPLVLEKLFSSKNFGSISKTAEAFLEGLAEKHILFYSENAELQKIISERGWSGEILPSSRDYISIVNTNVNGFKTDAVVGEKIEHKSEIQSDGSIVDTVSVTRKHSGGDSEYEWLNKVNADYMRVYVPQGSQLLEVAGQTIEKNDPPVDYDALGFARDEDVQREEGSIVIDENSGTRVYNESGKTVFANWTYVSPGETMTITYKYLLPFALFRVSVGDDAGSDSYSLVAQKQSGSLGSEFSSEISYPANYEIKWKSLNNSKVEGSLFKTETELDTDKFIGMLFVKKH